MKKYIIITTLVLGNVLLFGCSDEEKSIITHPDSSLNQQTSLEKKYTKEDAMTTFKSNKDFSDYEISDYVLVKDDKIPMLKAVISFYDKKNNNSSNLAFIYDDMSHEICFAVNEVDGVKTYEITDNSQLTYVGDGAVTLSIRNIDTNEVIDYKIIFSFEESTSTSNFKVLAEKPTK
ncbi:hypothetical protein AC623_10765 [Bacillus sp. FJAT-27231]|uniref:hypothetical protein n=1 Tax=Bacillus sp. FJAT-27231 TaxID=1679168 RepID=UPI0006707959|nr:hypothetical protein [Bacillus sp. FJAT-27231]KMY54350.1 hypothetical protein AC623_10765 [Bacillus sp. FJAT-27231]